MMIQTQIDETLTNFGIFIGKYTCPRCGTQGSVTTDAFDIENNTVTIDWFDPKSGLRWQDAIVEKSDIKPGSSFGCGYDRMTERGDGFILDLAALYFGIRIGIL